MKCLYLILLSSCIFLSSCKKLVEVESPITKFDAEKVYKVDASAIAVLTGIYQEMSGDGDFQGNNGISFLLGLTADELTDHSSGNTAQNIIYHNELNPSFVPFWQRFYVHIYRTNTAIQGISESKSLSPEVKKQLLGEAKFMRAFFYFYLVNLWGELPLVLTNDYKSNSSIPKTSKEKVYEQIIADLIDAENLLSSDYLLSDLVTSTEERIRPNKWVAKALLARAYLFTKKYAEAEIKATELIDNKNLFDLTELNNVFFRTSKEAIWQIQPINPVWNTYDSRAFILTTAPNFYQSSSISDQLISSFEPGDLRISEWIGSFTENGTTYYFPNKYKENTENGPQTEALVVFRLGEQYLIRAEARIELGNTLGGVGDLNLLRKRARATPSTDIPNPLPDISDHLSKEALLSLILRERQKELFTEWGHRWLDLKRSGRVDDVMKVITPLKGGTWNIYKALWPIPQSELLYNINMSQNSGY